MVRFSSILERSRFSKCCGSWWRLVYNDLMIVAPRRLQSYCSRIWWFQKCGPLRHVCYSIFWTQIRDGPRYLFSTWERHRFTEHIKFFHWFLMLKNVYIRKIWYFLATTERVHRQYYVYNSRSRPEISSLTNRRLLMCTRRWLCIHHFWKANVTTAACKAIWVSFTAIATEYASGIWRSVERWGECGHCCVCPFCRHN